MSVAAAGKSSWLAGHDAFGTVVAMGKWCGAYALLHQGIYALSLRTFPRSSYSDKLDTPHPKYWSASLRRVSTARVVAMTHAIASWSWSLKVLSGAWTALRAGRGSSMLAYDLVNDARGLAFMRHSLGYFVQELAHVLLVEPDPIFIAHHCLYILATFPIAALADGGWPLIAVATALAEATNPLQLAWEMSKAFGNEALYRYLSAPFTLAFALCRGLLMPITFLDILRYVHANPKPILQWTASLMLGGIVAGLAWLTLLVKGFLKYKRKRRPP